MPRKRRFEPPSMRVMAVKGMCRWCDKETEKKNVTWHRECIKACALANDSAAQRSFCLKRDHGVCASCGVDTVALAHERYDRKGRNGLDEWFIRREAERLFGWHYTDEKRTWVNETLDQFIKERGWSQDEIEWQADHIKPIHLANGDPSFFTGENLQTLCVKCHKEKSKREAGARALSTLLGL